MKRLPGLAVEVLAVALIVYACAYESLIAKHEAAPLVPIGIASAIVVGAFVLLGTRVIAGFIVGALAFVAWNRLALPPSVLVLGTLGIALQGYGVTVALGRVFRAGAFAPADAVADTVEPGAQAIRIFAICAAGACIEPTISGVLLCASGIIAWADFWRSWAVAWVADMLGMMLVIPLVLLVWEHATKRAIFANVLLPIGISVFAFGPIGYIAHSIAEAYKDSTAFTLQQMAWFQEAISILVLGSLVAVGTLLVWLSRAQARNELSISEQRLSRAALESAHESIVIVDAVSPDMPLIYVNRGFERMTGYWRSQVIGRNCRFLQGDAPEQEGLDTLRAALREQRECQVVLLNRRANGEAFFVEISVAPVRDCHGLVTHFVGIQKDITDRKRDEKRIQEWQKLEAIGQLTGGLAHDFNNLLGVVVGNLDQIGETLPAEGEVRGHHRAALDAALRGVEVTRSLLAVARRQPLEAGSHDLNGLLVKMLPLLRSSAGSAVSVVSHLGGGELVARLDAGGLSNVVLNLVINARDAMQEGVGEKELSLRTARMRVMPGEESLGLTPGGYAVLEVSDTGVGMSEEVRMQAFEPFFTTKERGKGTGLGLAMVYGYAEQLGGAASLESERGKGTTVRVYLPEAEAVEAERVQAGQDQAGQDRGEPDRGEPDRDAPLGRRVLVVDDEPGLCDLACIWLRSLGYEAEGVHSPQQVLQRLGPGQGEYEILFTDVVMPGGMDGVALARQALQMRPGLKVLLTSGYAKTLLGEDIPPGPLLSKPYRKSDLARAFERL